VEEFSAIRPRIRRRGEGATVMNLVGRKSGLLVVKNLAWFKFLNNHLYLRMIVGDMGVSQCLAGV